jgi:arabinose-5-phosphate isomerase
MNRIKIIKEFFDNQINSLQLTRDSIDENTVLFVNKILASHDKTIIYTGVGKAGLVSRTISSSMTSLGFPSYFIYPNELLHGELGHIKKDSLVIFLSKSGEAEELKAALPHLKSTGAYVVLITFNRHSSLLRSVDLSVIIEIANEFLLDGYAPSTSNIAFMTFFYSVLSVLINEINFTTEIFSNLHPSGIIGKKLNLRMRDLYYNGIYEYLSENSSFSEILVQLSSSSIGGVAVIDLEKKVIGVITDGDIRRLLTKKSKHDLFLLTASNIMNRNVYTASSHEFSSIIFNDMRMKRISFVPVTDEENNFMFSIGISSLVDLGFHE